MDGIGNEEQTTAISGSAADTQVSRPAANAATFFDVVPRTARTPLNITYEDPTQPVRPASFAQMVAQGWYLRRAKLMAGLRRHLAAPSLRLGDIQPLPLPTIVPGSSLGDAGTRLSALSVGVIIEGDYYTLPLLLKEPPVTPDGRVLNAVGQREYGIYHRLAAHLPLLVPSLVAGDPHEGWLVLEAVAGMRPMDAWEPSDYFEAIQNLVVLHDRFYGAGDDLTAFPWLARPFDSDYAATISAGLEAGRQLLKLGHLAQLMLPEYRQLVVRIIEKVDAIALPLKAQKCTLTHGDYWPGNIARQIDGPQMVFDWQLAGVAPGILDYVGFVQATRMYLKPPLSVEDLTRFYREKAAATMHISLDDAQFALLWDHALLWLFLTRWLGRLVTMPQDTYNGMHDRFADVWLQPLLAVAARRLG